MVSFHILSRRELRLSGVLAVLAGTSVLSAVVLVFDDAGRTPWFGAGTELAQMAERCGEQPSSTGRHRCLRQVAAPPPPMRLASAPVLP